VKPRKIRGVLTRLIPGGDITERSVKSGAWASAITGGNRVLQLAKIVVVASLLGPEPLGLLGIALLTLAALHLFSDFGIDLALIQREEMDVDSYLDTTWVVNIVRGVVLTAAAWSIAPLVGAFFGEPTSVDLIRGIGFSFLLLGFQNPAVMYFRKNLEFHREFVHQMTAVAVDVTVAVAFTLFTGSVWGLVAGKLTGDLSRLLTSYLIHDYRPKLRFDVTKGRELFGYGKWIMGSSVATFLIMEGDDVFVGWFLGAATLGLYQIAYRLAGAPATEITRVLSSTMFPTYSKLQGNPTAVRSAYFKTLQFGSFLIFPMSVGILVTASPFVSGFFGTEWLPMVPILQVLTFWGLLRAVSGNFSPVFRALGRPELETKLKGVKLVLVALLIYPATDAYGAVGTAGAILVVSLLVSEPLTVYWGLRLVDGTAREFVRTLAYPTVTSVAMGVVVYLARENIALAPVVEFVVLVLIGVVTYAVAVVAVESVTEYDIGSMFVLIRRNIL
jgi:PST family polysaccharide transporter/lipopolysaccharide exporter